MVGRILVEYCRSKGDLVRSFDHRNLDISDEGLVTKTLLVEKPEVVINCAAWTDVDGCELNPERAYAANTRGPENLANASREARALLITISTDYVFDGKKPGFYTQRDQPNPESIYGKSKLEGERRAQLASVRTIVVRTGFIFGPGGNNFLSMIVERARRGEKLKAISDSFGTPTFARDLSIRLRELAEHDLPGVFHVVNAGDGASYEEFARRALDLGGFGGTALESIETDALQRPAPRPRNSRLKCLLSEAIGLTPLPDWRDALADFVSEQLRESSNQRTPNEVVVSR
jgi:dTDP-4-dehydrorhamnose reductase